MDSPSDREALGLAQTAVLLEQVSELVEETEVETRFPRLGSELKRVTLGRLKRLLGEGESTLLFEDSTWSEEDAAFFGHAVRLLGAREVYWRLECDYCAQNSYCPCCCSCGGKRVLAVDL